MFGFDLIRYAKRHKTWSWGTFGPPRESKRNRYYDPLAGRLYVWPNSTVSLDKSEVSVPLLQTLVSVTGAPGAPALNVSFLGIVFSQSSATFLEVRAGPRGWSGAIAVRARARSVRAGVALGVSRRCAVVRAPCPFPSRSYACPRLVPSAAVRLRCTRCPVVVTGVSTEVVRFSSRMPRLFRFPIAPLTARTAMPSSFLTTSAGPRFLVQSSSSSAILRLLLWAPPSSRTAPRQPTPATTSSRTATCTRRGCMASRARALCRRWPPTPRCR